MALFKIFKGNETALQTGRPKAQEGFCYFCQDTGKFYIDIAGDGTSTDAVIGTNRIPINAYQSNLTSLATVSTRIPFGTCTTAKTTNVKTIKSDNETNYRLSKELLQLTDFDTLTAGYPEVGTMLVVYFENACNVANISFKIPYIGTAAGAEIPVYYKGDRLASYSYQTWDAFSLKQFVFMQDGSNNPIWRMIEEDKYDVDIAGDLTVNGDASFTQIPTAPTATAGDNSTQLATTAFVTSAINSIANEKLIIGTIEYDGSEEITIPIYDGAYTIA